MCCCDLCTVAGNSDKPNQALLASLNASLERTFWAQSGIPFDRIGEAMELNEIKTLHAHAFKQAMDVAFGPVIGPAASLICQKETSGRFSQPDRNPQLNVAAAGV